MAEEVMVEDGDGGRWWWLVVVEGISSPSCTAPLPFALLPSALFFPNPSVYLLLGSLT
jgi:hypothetical protein